MDNDKHAGKKNDDVQTRKKRNCVIFFSLRSSQKLYMNRAAGRSRPVAGILQQGK